MKKEKFSLKEKELLKKPNYAFLKVQRQFQKEISKQIHEIIKEEVTSPCSVSRFLLSKKKDKAKVYLQFSGEKTEDSLELLRKNASYIKRKLAKSKKFTTVPYLDFVKEEENDYQDDFLYPGNQPL